MDTDITATVTKARLENLHLAMSSPFWKGMQESTLTGMEISGFKVSNMSQHNIRNIF